MKESNQPLWARRSWLRSLAITGAGMELISANLTVAQDHEHGHDAAPPAEAGARSSLYFSEAQYLLLSRLCQLIIPPASGNSGGAIEARVPEFIDLLTSENQDYQLRLSGGLAWLDALCAKRFDSIFSNCTEAQQKSVLDAIAFRAGAVQDQSLLPGIEFFAFLRDLVLDGFFTSDIGIEYLEFRGNRALAKFNGCPEPKD